MPEGMNNTSEQAMGKGYTTYFFVDSIEEVSAKELSSCPTNVFSSPLLILSLLVQRLFFPRRSKVRMDGSLTLSTLKVTALASTNCAQNFSSRHGYGIYRVP
jgi:hypothetical protein